MKTRKQAEQRANELFPKVEGNDHIWTSRVVVEKEIKAFLQCWEDMQVAMDAQQAADEVDRDKQKEKINALLVTALRELTDSERVVLIKALQERT